MNNYKMIACDLDGTLLGSNLELSIENRQAIKELTELGVMIVPTTGRTLCEIENIFNLPEIRYVIYSNGAAVLDKETGEKFSWGLDGENLRFVFDTVSEFDTFMIIHKNGQTYADKEKALRPEHYRLSETVVELVRENCVLEDDFEKHILEGAVESLVVFFVNDSDMETCSNILSSNPHVQTVKSCNSNLEILSGSAGKGSSLKFLAEKLNIEIEDVISIGDGDNDRQMITMAGLGLAAENGCQELKEVCDKVICSNDEHIMRYVKEHYFS